MTILIGIIIIIGSILIWFHIPYSPVKSCFAKDVEGLKDSNKLKEEGNAFSSEDFSHLPLAIRRYIEYCGYIGTPKMSYLKMKYHDVDFMQGRTGPSLKMDYTQYDFVAEPCRMALIDSSMFGTPFEGYDYYQNGAGGIFTFNERYEYVLFTTNDRGVTNADGTMEYVPWSAVCGDYHVSENGIKYPTKFQAIWNYPDGDFVYFDGRISAISYE